MTTTYLANLTKANALAGKTVGNGQCEAFVQQVSTAPNPILWCKGQSVKDASYVAPGTVIAVFGPSGKYGNSADKTSHAAILLSRTVAGIWVLDQCHNGPKQQPVEKRFIRYMCGVGAKACDGNQFSIVI